MAFEIAKLPELLMREMAISWIKGEVFSELHIKPYSRELVFRVFPAAYEAMHEDAVKRAVNESCGFIFEMMELRVPGKTLRYQPPGVTAALAVDLPIFTTCRFFHKDQRAGLQKMIDEERLMKKWRAKQARVLPRQKYKY